MDAGATVRAMHYRVLPIPEKVAALARSTGVSPGYGHPVHREIASGYGPCRVCLQPFEVGVERRLLLTYDPFHDLVPFPLPGPIFIHEEPCSVATPSHRFPEALRFIPLTLNAYGAGRELREVSRLSPGGSVDSVIERLLSLGDVDYIHVRNTEAGCFICRVQRSR